MEVINKIDDIAYELASLYCNGLEVEPHSQIWCVIELYSYSDDIFRALFIAEDEKSWKYTKK